MPSSCVMWFEVMEVSVGDMHGIVDGIAVLGVKVDAVGTVTA